MRIFTGIFVMLYVLIVGNVYAANSEYYSRAQCEHRSLFRASFRYCQNQKWKNSDHFHHRWVLFLFSDGCMGERALSSRKCMKNSRVHYYFRNYTVK